MARSVRVYRCSRLPPELWEVELLMLFAGETPPPLPVFAEVLTGCWRLLADAEAAQLEAGGMEKDEAWEQAIRRMPAGVQSRLDGALAALPAGAPGRALEQLAAAIDQIRFPRFDNAGGGRSWLADVRRRLADEFDRRFLAPDLIPYRQQAALVERLEAVWDNEEARALLAAWEAHVGAGRIGELLESARQLVIAERRRGPFLSDRHPRLGAFLEELAEETGAADELVELLLAEEGTVWFDYAAVGALVDAGRQEEAFALLERTLPPEWNWKGRFLWDRERIRALRAAGRGEEALTAALASYERWPTIGNHGLLAETAAALGRWEIGLRQRALERLERDDVRRTKKIEALRRREADAIADADAEPG